MRLAALGSLLTCGFWLAGCAIHPVPEDVAGLATYDIVRQIRCETRQAVIDSALIYLTQGNGVDTQSQAIGLQFQRQEKPVQKLNPNLFKGPVRDILGLFWATGVAYNYKLEMTEVNNLGTEFNFLRPLTAERFSLGLKAGLDRQRQNTRTFTVTDTFGDLVQKISPDYCIGQLVSENHVYPITGRVGVEGMVRTFVYLSLFGNLGGPADKPKGPPTLVDALDFQTMVSGSASPKITFTPLGRSLSLTDASLSTVASRKDIHRVVIGLALDNAVEAQVAPVRNALFGRLLTATGRRSELAAANAVDQFLTQSLFSPSIVVNP